MSPIINYGCEELQVELPAEKWIRLVRPQIAAPLADRSAAMTQALELPYEYPPLKSALTPDDHLAVVVDHRIPGVGDLIAAVIAHVAQSQVPASAVTLVLPQSAEPFSGCPAGATVEFHDANDRKRLAYLAATEAGRRVYLNRTIVDADQVVVLASLHFDPAHGYVGPADFLYPEFSDTETQRAWQKSLTIEPPADEPWPLRREAEEVVWLLGAPFLIQVVPGAGDSIAAVIGGSIDSAGVGRQALDHRWRATVPQQADLAIAGISGDPQSLTAEDVARAMACAARAVANGGKIAVLTGGRPSIGQGLGSAGEYAGPAAALAALQAHPPADFATAYQWLRAAEKRRVYLMSQIPDDDVESLFVEPIGRGSEVQRLIDAAESVVLLPDAHRLLAAVEAKE